MTQDDQNRPRNTPPRDDEETVVGTVDARQGGRQTMNFHVLTISLLLAGIGFFVAWYFSILPI
jgi:hypothetical protein